LHAALQKIHVVFIFEVIDKWARNLLQEAQGTGNTIKLTTGLKDLSRYQNHKEHSCV